MDNTGGEMSKIEQQGAPPMTEARQRRLAELLREAREYLGLSQQFVAEHTGIPRLAIGAIENGKRKVEALELEALARLYRHPITHFLDNAENVLSEPATVRALAREASSLTEGDRDQVLRFARFLKSYGGSEASGGDTTRAGAPDAEGSR